MTSLHVRQIIAELAATALDTYSSLELTRLLQGDQ
jgi:hypothetical protein